MAGGRRRRLRAHAPPRSAFVVLLLVVGGIGACDSGFLDFPDIPNVQRTATIAGIVESVEIRETAPIVVLQDGRRVELQGSTPLIEIGTLEPGNLLLAGDEPTPWYGHIREAVPGCFALTTRGQDAGGDIVTELGLRLTKTHDFIAPVDPDQKYKAVPGFPFCLDSTGHVFSYDTYLHERSVQPPAPAAPQASTSP